MKFLNNATNILGKLSPQVQARIQAYLENPTTDGWQDISGIIVNHASIRHGTIWQAIRAVDPTFPNEGRTTGQGEVTKEWTRIPDAMLVARAIKQATKRP